MMIHELDFLASSEGTRDHTIIGGAWASAASFAYAQPGEGAAGASATAVSAQTTSTSTTASVQSYGRVISAHGNAYSFASESRRTSRAHSTSLALAIW